jgi:hypothetical protein
MRKSIKASVLLNPNTCVSCYDNLKRWTGCHVYGWKMTLEIAVR